MYKLMKLSPQVLCWHVPFAPSASWDRVCLRGQNLLVRCLRGRVAYSCLFFFSYQLLQIFKIISLQTHYSRHKRYPGWADNMRFFLFFFLLFLSYYPRVTGLQNPNMRSKKEKKITCTPTRDTTFQHFVIHLPGFSLLFFSFLFIFFLLKK